MNFINWLITYWPTILVIIVLAVWIVYKIKNFYKLPNSERVKRIKEWLLYWVTEAIKKYDVGEMDLAIAEIYGLFCDKFPIIKTLIPLDVVHQWIEQAFEKFQGILTAEGKTIATFKNPMIVK